MLTTPLTEMLTVYRACPRGLTEGEKYGRRLLSAPGEFASLFVLSVAQFSRYVNIDESFHGLPTAPEFSPEHGQAVNYTVDVAKRLAAADGCVVSGPDGFAFQYVDRELDVMRTSTTQLLDDGSPSKRALVLDLLLCHEDGTPILAEVKVESDTHPIYALVQVLAAAAHLVTPAQRARLANCYGSKLSLAPAAPFVDVALLLVDKPTVGKSATILAEAKKLGVALMDEPHVSSLIRAIHFLEPEDLTTPSLIFRRA